MDETKILPPVNPLTLAANLWILRTCAAAFVAQRLPGVSRVVTSDTRTADQNAKVGGAANSAHLHNLAEDFQLVDSKTGALVKESDAKRLYSEVIAPNWPGFTEFEASRPGEGYHIHWNLSRAVSIYSAAGVLSLLGIGTIAAVNHWSNNHGG